MIRGYIIWRNNHAYRNDSAGWRAGKPNLIYHQFAA